MISRLIKVDGLSLKPGLLTKLRTKLAYFTSMMLPKRVIRTGVSTLDDNSTEVIRISGDFYTIRPSLVFHPCGNIEPPTMYIARDVVTNQTQIIEKKPFDIMFSMIGDHCYFRKNIVFYTPKNKGSGRYIVRDAECEVSSDITVQAFNLIFVRA